MDEVQVFYYNLLAILYPTCPYDTGNMLSHIKLEETPEYFKITINAPKESKRGHYDYARSVNEGLCAKNQGRTRSAKEERNYHWIQRACKQAAQLTAEKVIFEGGLPDASI